MKLPNKIRSRRLQKKLHIGEFKELGFEFEVDLKIQMTPEGEEALVDCFLSEAVEPRMLALGGWITSGFIAFYGRGSVSEEDREFIQHWLLNRPEVKAVRVGQLKDAWHY